MNSYHFPQFLHISSAIAKSAPGTAFPALGRSFWQCGHWCPATEAACMNVPHQFGFQEVVKQMLQNICSRESPERMTETPNFMSMSTPVSRHVARSEVSSPEEHHLRCICSEIESCDHRKLWTIIYISSYILYTYISLWKIINYCPKWFKKIVAQVISQKLFIVYIVIL